MLYVKYCTPIPVAPLTLADPQPFVYVSVIFPWLNKLHLVPALGRVRVGDGEGPYRSGDLAQSVLYLVFP